VIGVEKEEGQDRLSVRVRGWLAAVVSILWPLPRGHN